MTKGTLYLVPTPIGNLGDITYRAVEVLNSVELIACEDTRTSSKLLNHYQIKKKLLSYHKFNERKQTAVLLDMLNAGKDVAVISDAGTPGISDPAAIIVAAALEAEISVTCLPGATALIPALAASGLSTESFLFTGFLPSKSKLRKELISKIAECQDTAILYESSHGIKSTLLELASAMPEREAVIAREISKLHETFYRGTLQTLAEAEMETRGEFVVLIAGKTIPELTDDELLKLIDPKGIATLSLSDVTEKYTAITGVNRNRIKKLVLALKTK